MAGDKNESYDIECPACKTTKYRNPLMKLMVNVCGHALCDSCVKTLFTKESGQCPECDMVLKRTKFRTQLFEDPLVEKEIDIRRRVARVYNKLEDDFSSCADYDNYLEEIEHMVHSMTNDINKAEVESQMELYERHHKEEIKKNYLRKSSTYEELDRIIEEEKIQNLRRVQEMKKEIEKHKKKQKTNHNDSLLKDLMASDGDASLIVRSHAERLKLEKEGEDEQELLAKLENAAVNPKEFSSGVRIGGVVSHTHSDVAALLQQAENYSYDAPKLAGCLPMPKWDSLESSGYLCHVRQVPQSARAGGYTEHYACMRALQEFMAGHMLNTVTTVNPER